MLVIAKLLPITCWFSLGYDAITMKWGMTSWTVDPSIATIRYYDPALDFGDYPCGL
jgi:hypothetical protein